MFLHQSTLCRDPGEDGEQEEGKVHVPFPQVGTSSMQKMGWIQDTTTLFRIKLERPPEIAFPSDLLK